MSDNSENRKPLRCPFAESIRNPITPETCENEIDQEGLPEPFPKQRGYVAVQVDIEQWNLFKTMFSIKEDQRTIPPDCKEAREDKDAKDCADPIQTDPIKEDQRVLDKISREVGEALELKIQEYVSCFSRDEEHDNTKNKDHYISGMMLALNTQHINQLREQAVSGRNSDKDALFSPVDHTIKKLFEQAVLESGGDYVQLLEEALLDKAKKLMGEDKAIELEAQLSAVRNNHVEYLRRQRLYQSQADTYKIMAYLGIDC